LYNPIYAETTYKDFDKFRSNAVKNLKNVDKKTEMYMNSDDLERATKFADTLNAVTKDNFNQMKQACETNKKEWYTGFGGAKEERKRRKS